jgi:hypothetical protein
MRILIGSSIISGNVAIFYARRILPLLASGGP